jgi:hypothetical protein
VIGWKALRVWAALEVRGLGVGITLVEFDAVARDSASDGDDDRAILSIWSHLRPSGGRKGCAIKQQSSASEKNTRSWR